MRSSWLQPLLQSWDAYLGHAHQSLLLILGLACLQLSQQCETCGSDLACCGKLNVKHSVFDSECRI